MTRLPSFVKKNLERMFSKYFGLVKTAASNTLWSRLKQEVVTFARAWNVSGTQGKFSIVKSLFTISLARIRTKQILREKAGCKQSRKTFLNVWNKHDLETRNIVRRVLRVCLNNRGFPSFLCRALVTRPHMERFKIVFFRRTETYI